MAERDSTKTPVAAEALIAAAAPLALHRIPRGRPAPASGSARAPRPCPSRRPAPRRVPPRPARPPRRALSSAPSARPPAAAGCAGQRRSSRRRPRGPPAQGRWDSAAGEGRRRGTETAPCRGTGAPGGARSAGRRRSGRRARGPGDGRSGQLVIDDLDRLWAELRASRRWSQTRGCHSGKGPGAHPRGEPTAGGTE